MNKKILIGITIIPIIIMLVIAIPKISPGGEQISTNTISVMRVEFIKEDIKRVSYGVTERAGAIKSEILVIDEKGKAFYDLKVDGEKGVDIRFKVSSQDIKRLKGLITDTGFMHIPKSEFAVKNNKSEFTRYKLNVSLDNQAKTVQWVDQSASKDFVPPLLTMMSDAITKIIENYT
mgnify:CR=1 FL=1